MIIQIRMRDNNGKFTDVLPGDFAAAAIEKIFDYDEWEWARNWLCRVCLRRAERHADDKKADMWIARYQAIRSIK